MPRPRPITHGADGMELATAEGALRAAPPRLGAYPVGSGDAALGGFLAALDARRVVAGGARPRGRGRGG